MHNISNDMRRATRDLDLDFIKYSLEDNSIINFINILNKVNIDANIKLVGKIKPLHHMDYDGKRVNIEIEDKFNNIIFTQLDIGVEKNFNITQDEYCFNLDVIDKNVNLLINSKEQIFCEKLKSLLKIGVNSIRYKDIFDFYYLITETKLDNNSLYLYIKKLIFQDISMRENTIQEIINRLNKIFENPIFLSKLTNPKINWLNIPVDRVIDSVINYLENLETIVV